jgi:molecular chaperone GrpE
MENNNNQTDTLNKELIEEQHTSENIELEANSDDTNQVDNSSETENVISDLEKQLEESKDKYLRLFAEFDNYKKRVMKERLDLIKNASQETILNLLPVVDDFERAKKASEGDKPTEHFSDGIVLVYNKFHQILQNLGLSEMDTTGQNFDVEKHEAVSEIDLGPEWSGKIIDTVQKGYKLNEKIIRYAKVVVGK